VDKHSSLLPIINFTKISGMDKVKTYDEELEELEQFLEKDKEQKQKVESYTKKGFKIKKTPLITPPRTNEKIPVVEPRIAPSYNVPVEVDTIPCTPVAVKTLEDRAQERNERKHQEHLRQIAKEKIDELLRRKEAERKQSEEEERRKREERNLEQQAGESDDSYLRRIAELFLKNRILLTSTNNVVQVVELSWLKEMEIRVLRKVNRVLQKATKPKEKHLSQLSQLIVGGELQSISNANKTEPTTKSEKSQNLPSKEASLQGGPYKR